MKWEEFCNNLKEILELDRYKNSEFMSWDITDKKLIINFSISEEKIIKFTYTKTKFQKDYNGLNEDDDLNVFNNIYYEVPISIKNEHFPIMPRYNRIIGIEYKDNENNFLYKIDKPSEQFFIKMIEQKIRPNAIMIFRRAIMYDRYYEEKKV